MILGVGLDLADIARIERAIEKPHFLERIYSEEERARIAQKGAQTAAGYFAAKEAVAKALGTGLRGFGMWDICIHNDDLGKPVAILKNGALVGFKPHPCVPVGSRVIGKSAQIICGGDERCCKLCEYLSIRDVDVTFVFAHGSFSHSDSLGDLKLPQVKLLSAESDAFANRHSVFLS